MSIFDIIGPVMVGPSSSHTAGAVINGNVGRKVLGDDVRKAVIEFHGSFLMTGKGHGTDRALVAGLLGMKVDDSNIPRSFEIAEERGLEYHMEAVDLGDAHPNSVRMTLFSETSKMVTVIAASIGGGRIEICEVDGLRTKFSGDYPTLIINNEDRPGLVKDVTFLLANNQVNIGSMQVHRSSRGENAVMVLECEQEGEKKVIQKLEATEGINKVTYLSLVDEKKEGAYV